MFTKSALTLQLCEILRQANGDVSFAAIENATGLDREALRPRLHAARGYLDKEEGIAFSSVRGVGLRRMTDSDKVSDAGAIRKKVYKTAHKGSHRVGSITNWAAMTPAEQLQAQLAATIFHAVREASAEKPQK